MSLSWLGWKPGRLARNTLWAISGQTARLLIQAAYFILIARSLGPNGYGTFVSVAAMIAVFSAFVGFGTGPLLVKHVARNSRLLQSYWGRSLGVIGMSGIAFILLSLWISERILPPHVPCTLVLMLAVSDLLLMPFHLTCTQVFQARERLGTAAALHIVMAGMRLVAVAVMITVLSDPTALSLAQYYLVATSIASVVSMSYVAYEYGPPRWTNRELVSDIRQGLGFTSSTVAQYATANVDKTMLASMSTAAAAGIYSAAQRVVEIALMPVFALLAAAIPRFFLHGRNGIRSSFAIAHRLMYILVAYTSLAAIVLYFVAPLLPLVFGPQYHQSETVTRWLVVLPFLHMLHAVAADVLSGAGYQKLRSLIEISAAILNVLLNWLLVQKYSYLGSVVALLATFAFSAAGLWFAKIILIRKRAATG